MGTHERRRDDGPGGQALENHADSSLRVVGAVASELGIDPVDCEPLYESIDPTALDELFTTSDGTAGRVIFEYAGYSVTVDNEGQVTLAELSDT
ncbi:HalOD1 output domain-containing protein [Natronolimnohabitans sp. A-GB9]|uniref:HalOD1 output domain-containing protein n=1 Tax=Natronolimnohabitans sp. A-GB9 TaxID=3069757 RepID=UPI0027B73F0A|nr:HalOD1 output domain-containing protein [Natronolimnohabitans sp. A-GB9]MDQ2049158.1 HalOD1 output domain-containing protein [Natronolimnohabitans sp. A-GB9]